MLVFGAAGGILGPLLPMLAHDFGVPIAYTGLLISATFAGSLAAVVTGGYLADRFGKARLFRIALGGLTLAYLGTALAPSFAVIAAAIFCAGALGGTLEGFSSAVIADLDSRPAQRDRNLNLLQVAFCAGAVAAIGFTASMVHGQAGLWRGVFGTLGGIAGGIWLLSLGMRVPPAPSAERITLAIARRVIIDPAVVLLALAICCYVGSEMSLASWISPLLKDRLHYSDAVAMLGAACFWLAMGLARIGSGFACQRYPGIRVLGWLVAGGLVAYICFLLPLGPWHYWLGIIAAGVTFSGIWPLLVSLGSAHYPGYSGTVVAVMVTSGTLGGLIFPFLTGLALQGATPYPGLTLMALVFGALAVMLGVYRRRMAASSEMAKTAVV